MDVFELVDIYGFRGISLTRHIPDHRCIVEKQQHIIRLVQ